MARVELEQYSLKKYFTILINGNILSKILKLESL